jgi:NitT/TauT family transport system substrate-binding protein
MADPNRLRLLQFLASAAALATASRASAQSAPLRIATAIGPTFASPYYTADGGFLAKQGLNAEIGLFTNGGTVMQAVAGNAADIGLADSTQLANAVARGIPFSFFAGGGLYRSDAPTSILCVAKNSPLKLPKDVEGGTVAVIALKSATEIAMRRWMEANQIDANRVRLLEVPLPDIPGVVARGTVAAGVLSEPVLSAAVNGGDVVVFAKPFDAIAKRFYLSAWFATHDWLTANAATAAKLSSAIYEAARWSNDHPDLTAPILAKHEKFDLERVRAMTHVTQTTSLDPALLQPVLDAAAETKIIPAPVDATRLITRV